MAATFLLLISCFKFPRTLCTRGNEMTATQAASLGMCFFDHAFSCDIKALHQGFSSTSVKIRTRVSTVSPKVVLLLQPWWNCFCPKTNFKISLLVRVNTILDFTRQARNVHAGYFSRFNSCDIVLILCHLGFHPQTQMLEAPCIA